MTNIFLRVQVGVSFMTVWKLMHEYQLYPYHLQTVQALTDADYPLRVQFAQWFLQQTAVQAGFPSQVLFTGDMPGIFVKVQQSIKASTL